MLGGGWRSAERVRGAQVFYSDVQRTSTVVEEMPDGTLVPTTDRVSTRSLEEIPPEKRNALIDADATFLREAAEVPLQCFT